MCSAQGGPGTSEAVVRSRSRAAARNVTNCPARWRGRAIQTRTPQIMSPTEPPWSLTPGPIIMAAPGLQPGPGPHGPGTAVRVTVRGAAAAPPARRRPGAARRRTVTVTAAS